jgi:hypothetical protein
MLVKYFYDWTCLGNLVITGKTVDGDHTTNYIVDVDFSRELAMDVSKQVYKLNIECYESWCFLIQAAQRMNYLNIGLFPALISYDTNVPTEKSTEYMKNMPLEIWHNIFQFVDKRSVGKMLLVNKHMCEIGRRYYLKEPRLFLYKNIILGKPIVCELLTRYFDINTEPWEIYSVISDMSRARMTYSLGFSDVILSLMYIIKCNKLTYKNCIRILYNACNNGCSELSYNIMRWLMTCKISASNIRVIHVNASKLLLKSSYKSDAYHYLFITIPITHSGPIYNSLYENAAIGGKYESASELYKLTKIDDKIIDTLIAKFKRDKKLDGFKWLCSSCINGMTFHQFNECYMWAIKWKYLDILTILTERNKKYITEKYINIVFAAAMKRQTYCNGNRSLNLSNDIIHYLKNIKIDE